jgi:hypothetical protein
VAHGVDSTVPTAAFINIFHCLIATFAHLQRQPKGCEIFPRHFRPIEGIIPDNDHFSEKASKNGREISNLPHNFALNSGRNPSTVHTPPFSVED